MHREKGGEGGERGDDEGREGHIEGVRMKEAKDVIGMVWDGRCVSMYVLLLAARCFRFFIQDLQTGLP